MITILTIAIITAIIAVVANIADEKQQKARTQAMRPLWAEKAERRANGYKAVVAEGSMYHSANRLK